MARLEMGETRGEVPVPLPVGCPDGSGSWAGVLLGPLQDL